MQTTRRGLLQFGAGVALLALLPAVPIQAMTQTRPPLQSPETVDIHSKPGLQRFVLKDGRDYIFRIGPDSSGRIITTEIKIIGGRNIEMIGGHIIRANDTPTNDAWTGQRIDPSGSTLNLLGHTGTAWIEGVLIDANDQFGVDALDLGGADLSNIQDSGDFILHNIHIRGVSGNHTAKNKKAVAHADGLQFWGAVRSLRATFITVYSGNQGINIQPENPLGLVEFDRCNLRYPDPDITHGRANGYALWLGDGHPYINPAKYVFKDVYVEMRQAWNAAWEKTSIAPDISMPNGARLVKGTTDRATWVTLGSPNQAVTGYVTKGIPPGGDFCPPSRIVDDAGHVIYKATS